MRLLIRLLALLAGLALLVAAAPLAHADEDQPSSWHIPRYDATAQLAPDGTAMVTVDLDFDFSSDAGHGPFISLPLRQEVLDDPDVWRMLDVEVESVTSRTGANTEVFEEVDNGVLLVRVGREGETFTGVQNYVITYRITGLIAPNQAQSGLDELNWNAIGTGWQVPIRQARVRVEGPAEVSRTACFSGPSFDNPCDHSQEGNTATYAASDLGTNGAGMQVVAGFPAGTFVGAEPRYTKRPNFGNMFPATPLTAGLTAVLALVGVGTVIHQVRRRGRDHAYLGLTPGLAPAPGEEAKVGTAKRQPVTVQFHPPRGATPGEIGVLIDARADNRDVTGAIIDLAVRGHLHIDQVGKKTWNFTRLQTRDRLAAFEEDLVDRLFHGQRSVTTDDMKDKAYAGVLTDTRTSLYRQVTERGWFHRRPDHAKLAAIVIGALLVFGGLIAGFVLGLALGWGLIGAALVVTGLLLIALAKVMPARTAEGSAMLSQAKGFELYLRTAEADQIRFEEGIDVYSRYLPYAIVFGVAERWTKVFEKLAAAGRYEPDMRWYGSPHGTGFFYGAAFASTMNQMTASMSSAMSSAVTAATAGSGGGSGFSGGGGFGGGGGGGW